MSLLDDEELRTLTQGHFVVAPKESSIGDPEWGMYVTPDDPARDTPEKARIYYERLFKIMGIVPPSVVKDASADDIAAAEALLGPTDPVVVPGSVQSMVQLKQFLDRLDREVATISGLNDLQKATAGDYWQLI